MKVASIEARIRHFLLILPAVCFFACSTSRLSSENLNSRFSYGSDLLNPEFSLYHLSADSTALYFHIPENGLLYKSDADGYAALLSVHWSVYPSYSSKQILDSGTVAFLAKCPVSNGAFDGAFGFHLGRKAGVVVKLEFVDVNRQVSALRYQSVTAPGALSAPGFFIDGYNRNGVVQEYSSSE